MVKKPGFITCPQRQTKPGKRKHSEFWSLGFDPKMIFWFQIGRGELRSGCNGLPDCRNGGRIVAVTGSAASLVWSDKKSKQMIFQSKGALH